MNQPLLTVIVPCYNVEEYLDKCMHTIVGQTYSNLEILLVVDNCPDNTDKICNEWQERDTRVRIIHGENQGLSYARKVGIENTTGEYVAFVDADDWIDTDMYSNMMSALLSTNSDIVQCGVCDAFEDGRIQHRSFAGKDGTFEIIDRIRGVLLIIEDKEWRSYPANKVFKKQLFDHVEFPKGRGLSEDTTYAHILFHYASQSVYLRDEYYFYLHRGGSITQSNQNLASKMKNWYDTYNAFYERYCFVEQRPEYHSHLIHAKNNAFSRGIRALRNSMIHPQYFPSNYSNSVMEQLKAMRFARKDFIKDLITPLMRAEVSIFLTSPACYRWLIMLYARINRWTGRQ